MIRAIFLDTNVFYRIQFNVDDEFFTKLVEKCRDEDIEIWITDITKQEIFNGIDRKINELKLAYDTSKKLLSNINEFRDVLKVPAIDKYVSTLKEDISAYFKENNFVILNYDVLDESDIEKIFTDYFKQTGIFTPKKRASKSFSKEFPDAFQLEILKRKARCGDSITIISDDQDFINAIDAEKTTTLKYCRSIQDAYRAIDINKQTPKIEINDLEHLILYYLDDYATNSDLKSFINFHSNRCNLTQINSSLAKLTKCNLVEKYVYNNTIGSYSKITSDPINQEKTWYKKII